MLQGTYDPNTYDPNTPATWPQPASPGPYTSGMFWDIGTAGTWNGDPVAVGDRLYAVGRSRLFRDGAYGAGYYGEPAAGPWSTVTVAFVAWFNVDNGWDTDAPPWSGCELADGWRIVVEAFYNADDTARRYGDDTHGAEVFGDLAGLGQRRWHDITPPTARALVTFGATAGESWQIPAETITLDVYDAAAWQITGTATRAVPNVGELVRVGVLDQFQQYWPIATGIVEAFTATHDAPPRLVTVEAFGIVTEVAAQLPGTVNRPAEGAAARIRWIADQTGYRWGPPQFDSDPGPTVTAYGPETDVSGRELADVTAISAGWSLDTTRRGIPRTRPWPFELDPFVAPLVVTDCVTEPADVWSPSIVFTADTSSTVNRTTVFDNADPPASATDDDPASITKVGVQTAGAGVPLPPLDCPPERLAGYAAGIVDALSGVLHRVESIEADTDRDPRWFAVLAALDRGDPVEVHRTEGPAPTVFRGYVAGVQHDIAPGRWFALITVHTTTDTIH